jgi:cysteinyl-tRNA synthetase
MSQKYLGDEFDIHTGGKDHIFPHHPNERAQAFAASGKGQARYWLHNEFINIEGEKMSKSEGNFYTVRELLDEGFTGDALRLYINSSHYRSETNFSKEGLEKAEKELNTLRKAYSLSNSEGLEEEAEELKEDFEKFMDDDLNTAKAKQALLKFAGEVNSRGEASEEVGDTLRELSMVLGIDLRPDATDREASMADLLSELRDEAREREDYETSDFIRDQLEDLGFEVEDSGDGSKWF